MNQAQRGIDTVMLPCAAGVTTSRTANLDCIGASWVTVRISVSEEINTDAEPCNISILHGATTDATAFTTMVADQSFTTVAAARELRYEINMLGKERWIRLDINPDGGTISDDAYTVCAIATLTRNLADPATTSGMGDDTVVSIG